MRWVQLLRGQVQTGLRFSAQSRHKQSCPQPSLSSSPGHSLFPSNRSVLDIPVGGAERVSLAGICIACPQETTKALGLRRLSSGVEKVLRAEAVKGSKKIFLYNLKARLGKESEALGMEKMYVERIEQTFEGIWNRHQHLITDERSLYHVQAASLVLSSYRVLTEQLNIDRDKSITILKQSMGDSDSMGERLVRETLSVLSLAISKASQTDCYSNLKEISRRMTDVDFGKAFDVVHEESADETQHICSVRRCIYHSFFTENDAPELVGPIFCAADRSLFQKASGISEKDLKTGSQGATLHLESTLAEGSEACKFVLRRTDRKGD